MVTTFVVTRPTHRLADLKNRTGRGVTKQQTKILSHGSTESVKALNGRWLWRKTRSSVPARFQTF